MLAIFAVEFFVSVVTCVDMQTLRVIPSQTLVTHDVISRFVTLGDTDTQRIVLGTTQKPPLLLGGLSPVLPRLVEDLQSLHPPHYFLILVLQSAVQMRLTETILVVTVVHVLG